MAAFNLQSSNLTLADLKKVGGSIALAIFLSLLGGIGVYWMEQQTVQGKKSLQEAQMRFEEADRKLRQVHQEEQEIREKSTLFGKLSSRRIISASEDRLSWVELLDSIQKRRQLFPLEYEFQPQQKLGAALGRYQLTYSQMRFTLPMLHEGDLFALLFDLRREAPALVLSRDCSIERSKDAVDPKLNQTPTLKALCQLSWVSLLDTERKGAK